MSYPDPNDLSKGYVPAPTGYLVSVSVLPNGTLVVRETLPPADAETVRIEETPLTPELADALIGFDPREYVSSPVRRNQYVQVFAPKETPVPSDAKADEVRTAPQLLAEGGKFYRMGHDAYCDTPLEVWRLDPERGGYVRVPEPGEGKEGGDA